MKRRSIEWRKPEFMAKRVGTVRPLRLDPSHPPTAKGGQGGVARRPDGRRPAVAYIGIGSNRGDREAFCREAVNRLAARSTVRIKKVSSLYETEPMEYLNQDRFYNAVVEIETALSPLQLLKHCQKIENQLGKKIDIPKGPRTIDLDLLFYNQRRLNRPGLILPHPAAALRPFVLVPLSEIAPDFLHPLLHQTASALLGRLPACIQIEKKIGPGWEKQDAPESAGRREKAVAAPRARSRGR